jgi:hypothetical protein
LIFQAKTYYKYLTNIRNYTRGVKGVRKKFYLQFFSSFMHKKQLYVQFLTSKKLYNFSTGQLLTKKIEKIKFFKKSIQNINYSISCLNRKFRKSVTSIYLLYCKNYNYKNYLWLKKFFTLNKPRTEYVVLTHSWNYITKKKRRIKRKILKRLKKYS